MKVLCPAKINLFLEVTGRRPDGYHRLATLFAKINLYDVVELEADPAGRITLTVEGGSDIGGAPPEGPGNLVWKAAEAFRTEFAVAGGVHIKLVKRIPSGAGLGGGSSDAAGTLLGLAKVFEVELGPGRMARLRRLARGLGADVPFFMQPAALCLGTGVGEVLKPIRAKKSFPYMILVYPGFSTSTPEVYRGLELPRRADVLTRLSHLDRLVRALERGRPPEKWRPLLFNRLESSRLPALAQVEQARRVLERLGAAGVRMTGSGSCLFGFVGGYREGEKLAAELGRYPWKVYLTSCL